MLESTRQTYSSQEDLCASSMKIAIPLGRSVGETAPVACAETPDCDVVKEELRRVNRSHSTGCQTGCRRYCFPFCLSSQPFDIESPVKTRRYFSESTQEDFHKMKDFSRICHCIIMVVCDLDCANGFAELHKNRARGRFYPNQEVIQFWTQSRHIESEFVSLRILICNGKKALSQRNLYTLNQTTHFVGY